MFNLHFIKVSTENDNNFGYDKITVLVDNMPLTLPDLKKYICLDLICIELGLDRVVLEEKDLNAYT